MAATEKSARLHQAEARLDDFDPEVRAGALATLVQTVETASTRHPTRRPVANMHCHTFFSYNGYGHSPSALAWGAKKRGIHLMGIVDFDVLDGVDEFLEACELLGVRGSAGMETRVYLPEFADREMNSPGEPGIYYHMGIGFTASRVPETARPILEDLRARADRRNRVVLERLNAHLDPVTIDYEREVLPLSPGTVTTERHIVEAFVRAVAERTPEPASFWADRLALPGREISDLMQDSPALHNTVRARLIKRGGVAYMQPGPDSFPAMERVHELILGCEAIPCATWLDGTSTGEQAIEELLALLIEKGAAALNIIPDRNWNIPDPELRRQKIEHLYRVVEMARDLALPLNIGTEMNVAGQKWVDDFDAPELAPVRDAFLDGAYFAYGHTVLARHYKMGYQSEWADAHLPGRPERNAFYTRAGRHLEPQVGASLPISPEMTPAEVLRAR